MLTSTSSTYINIRTVFRFGAGPFRSVLPELGGEVVRRAEFLAADPDYPSAAVIRCLTRRIIAAILTAGGNSASEKQQN